MISAIWGVQIFMAGLSLTWVMGGFIFIAGIGSILALIMLKFVLIDFRPHAIEGFQVGQALSFSKWWLAWQRPGRSSKEDLPDAHSDFILAVIGEEFGLLTRWLFVYFFLLF